jgi:tetratricopeptide (TPR) repeat protein
MAVHAAHGLEGDDAAHPAVAIASRVCDMTPPNRVSVTDVARSMAGFVAGVGFHEVDSGRMRDFADEVAVWALDVEGVLSAEEGLASLSRGFVGRAAEMATIRGQLELAAGRRGSLTVVSGEPGIGKTRVAEEAATLAERRGFVTAWSAAWEHGASPPLALWTELLRGAVDVRRLELRESDRGELARLLPELGAPTASDGEIAQVETFEAVVRTLSSACEQAPLLLVIDDVQWVDAASRQLLEYVASKLHGLPLAMIATYRDTEPGDAAETVDRLARLTVRLELHELDDTDAVRLAASTGFGIGEATAEAAAQRGGGNPFYIRELARLAAAGGLDATGLDAVPPSVRAVLERRMARLPQPTSELLELAALVGGEFRLDLLAAVTSTGPTALLERLEPALGARLCRDQRGGRLAFAHPLVRSTLVESQSASARMRRHLAIAEVLERSPALGNGPSELAHHLAGAAPLVGPARILPHDMEAGRAALARTAFSEAIFHFERALGSVATGETRDRIDILIALGDSLRQGGERRRSRASFTEAADLARAVGDIETIGVAALGMTEAHMDAGVGMPVADHEAIALVDEALAKLPSHALAMRARLKARLSSLLRYWSDSSERSRRLGAEAASEAVEAGDAELERQVRIECRTSDLYREPIVDVVSEICELTEGSDRPTYLHARSMTALCRATIETDLSGLHSAIDSMNVVVARFPSTRWLVHNNDAMLAHLHGDLGRAESAAMAILELPRSQRGPMATTMASMIQYYVRWESGQLIEIEDLMRHSAEERMPIPVTRAMYALLLAQTGSHDRARPIVRQLSIDHCRGVWDDVNAPAALFSLAYAATIIADPTAARALHQRLLQFSGMGLFVGAPGIVAGHIDQALAVTAATAGDLNHAEQYFTSALEAAGRMQAPLWRARTKADHAAALAAHGEDAARARRLAEEARLEAARHGAFGIASAAERVLEGLAVPRVETGRLPVHGDGVFHREGDVWLLRYAGMEARLRHSKGLADLAVLIARPGREVHVAELVGSGDLPSARGDELVDEKAISAYRARLADLAEEEDDARRSADAERAARARAQYDDLVEHLTRSLGMDGRSRRSDDWTERARKTVRSRIGNTLKRIDVQHPPLGRHLRASIRTGLFCRYEPPDPVSWQL